MKKRIDTVKNKVKQERKGRQKEIGESQKEKII